MALISPASADKFSQKFEEFFDYFAREFTVHKEPTKVIAQAPVNELYGYNDQSAPQNYTYIPVNAQFKGRISYNKKQSEDILADLQFSIAKGIVTLVVKENAKNYIENGATLKIEFDGKTFNKTTTPAIRKYLNNTYYQYYLEEIK